VLEAFDQQIAGSPPGSPPSARCWRRSLGPARYTVKPGVALRARGALYLHFTSPIRRYADLAVHRVVKRYLHGERSFTADVPALDAVCRHINERARASTRAENDRRRMLTAAFMADRLGEVFDARVTRVRPFGLVAQLDTSLIEGTLPFDALPGGPYEVDASEAHARSPSRTFAIGAPVRVRAVSTDVALGRVTFALVEAPEGAVASAGPNDRRL
jgi:ribonuclease R